MKYRLPEFEVPADNPFKNDALERRPLVEFLSKLIGRLPGPFVLALDSPWGTGKTTLIRMVQAELTRTGFECVHFNAWQVDYINDPLVALVAAVDDIRLSHKDPESKFRSHLRTVRKITTAVAKRGAVAAAKAVTLGGLEIDKEFEAVAAEAVGGVAGDAVDAFQKEKAALKKFRTEIEKAVEQLKDADRKSTLIFFIDELDRCRPTFAIEMLERVKHLFDLPNIVFVLSIDKTQLQASVGAVYGAGVDAPEYLRRFIDLEYGLPRQKSDSFTEALLSRYEIDSLFTQRNSHELEYDKRHFVEFFTALSNLFDLSLRARERCMTCFVIVMEQTPSNHYLDPILVAFLLVLRIKRFDVFQPLVDGITSPADAMTWIATQPGGTLFCRSREGAILEANLIAADPDRDRQGVRMKEISELSKDTDSTSSAHMYARELQECLQWVMRGSRGRMSLRVAASKIDMVAMIRN
jgi:hypothetical protein